MSPDYSSGWQDLEIVCGDCGWRGTGSDTAQGELFEQLYERDCPQCFTRLLVISFPMADEIRGAAASGNQEALSMLKNVEFREERWARWEAERLSRVEQLPDIDGPVITARIDIGPDLELWLNDELVHREPGFYETIEPLKRIVALLRTKYGERLKSIDTSRANDYLWGDRSASIAEGTAILKESGFDNHGRQFAEGSSRDDQP